MNAGEATPAISVEMFREQLARVLQSHQKIAEVIEQVSLTVPQGTRSELRPMAAFFAQPRSAEDVLHHPAALSLCLPLMAGASDGELAREDIELSVHRWIRDTAHRRWQTHRRLAAFAYPWIVLALCVFVLTLLCVFLVPEFEQTFDDFGLTLPAPTVILIGFSHLIIGYGAETLAVLLVVAIVLLGIDQWRRHTRRATLRSRLDRVLESDRGALADWAWHTASLIQAGLSRHDAVAIAGTLSTKRWLRRGAAVWAKETTGPAPTRPDRMGHHPCHLAAHALQLPQAASQAAMLREAAAIHRDRDRRKSGWWIAAASQAAVCLVGLMLLLVVAALFMPLVELISGLS